mgnify:CR=1 FL=1
MYKYNPFIMQNIRANTLIIGANNNPINKKVRLNADFSINYKKTALLFAHLDRKSTRLNSSHMSESRMPSSA